MARAAGAGESQFTELGIPSEGMDTDTVPRLLSPRKASLLKNFLMDRPGVLPMRGPICEGVTWSPGASIGLLGVWAHDDSLLISRIAAGATNTRDYWTAPYRRTSSPSTELRELNTTQVHIQLSTGTVTNVTGAAPADDKVIGLCGVRIGLYIYGPAADEDPAGPYFSADGGLHKRRLLLRWDGSAAAATVYANAPKSAQSVAFHYNRLFALGGAPSGSSLIRFNALFWSDPLAPDGTALPDTAAAWQDDVSGLTNEIVIGGEQDFGVALAHVGANLCIFKRRSMWMLYGTAPSNFSVKQVSNEVGCIDPRSVVEYDGGVFFMSERGFMFYDGTKPRLTSDGLTSSLTASALKQVGPRGVDGGYVRATNLGNGYILVTTGVIDGATITTAADSDAWLLHAPSGAWTQFSSGALTSIVAGGRTQNHTYLLTDQKLVKANYLFAPQNAPAGLRGFDSIDSGATKFVIPSRWTTRALSLGTPTRKSQLRRIVADYYWGLANGGWQVTATTRGASGVVNTAGTLGAPTGIAATLPARGGIDVFNETDEAYLDLTATSSAPATFNDAELHRVLVESATAARVAAAL